MLRARATCIRLGAFAGALAVIMFTVAVPIAVALDSNKVLDEDIDTAAVPQVEPTPLPEPDKVVKQVVDEAEKTVKEVVSTVEETVDPSEPEPAPGSAPDPDQDGQEETSSTSPPQNNDSRRKKSSAGSAVVAQPVADVVNGATNVLKAGNQVAAAGPRFDGLPQEFWMTAPYPYQPGASVGGSRSTVDVMFLLGGLNASPEQAAQVLAPFPVAGVAGYSDDFGAPRDGGERRHAGTDIFAEHGTPVIASADGQVSNMAVGTALGGTSLRVTEPDGTYYYYAHLGGFAPGIAEGTPVAQGDVLGFVGNTGNAAFTPPHLHYEIHPGGGAAVDPVPILDGWLADALREARQFALSPLAPLTAPALVPPDVQTAGAAVEPLAEPPPVLSSDPVRAGTGVGVLVLLGIAALLTLVHAAPAIAAPYRPR